MSEIRKRLLKMSNKFGYKGREEERKAIIKEHLTNYLEYNNLTLQDIAKEPDLIYEHYVFNEWMLYSFDIYLFFDIDILDVVNDFLVDEDIMYQKEYGPSRAPYVEDYVLVHYYAERIAFKHIDQWAEEEKKGVANV
jgi:hypothetical protein